MKSLSVVQVQVEGFDKNFSYLVACEATRKAVLVDPCGEIERVFDALEARELTLVGVFITHTHFDHHDKLDAVLVNYFVPVYLHKLGEGRTSAIEELTRFVGHDDEIVLGEGTLKVYYTPGHFDDCLCFYITSEEAHDSVPKLITGDTLFVEGCGRTTVAGVEQLYNSLQFLKTFPDETEIYTGHNYGSTPISTIGREKQNNKYFLAQNFDEFRVIRLPNG
jgi:glyoxylase-like metal-dependent hydrolase (beta-lactamase superfamily II)